jgi:NADH pyrophosphatase NudC (nudix superfamily)
MEEDFFAKLSREKLEKLKAEQAAKAALLAKAERAALHHHRCGKCGGQMETKMHRGVHIEICPDCGAVLLDKGELEQLAGQDESGFLTGIASLFRPNS